MESNILQEDRKHKHLHILSPYPICLGVFREKISRTCDTQELGRTENIWLESLSTEGLWSFPSRTVRCLESGKSGLNWQWQAFICGHSCDHSFLPDSYLITLNITSTAKGSLLSPLCLIHSSATSFVRPSISLGWSQPSERITALLFSHQSPEQNGVLEGVSYSLTHLIHTRHSIKLFSLEVEVWGDHRTYGNDSTKLITHSLTTRTKMLQTKAKLSSSIYFYSCWKPFGVSSYLT